MNNIERESDGMPCGELPEIPAPDGLDAIAREAERFDALVGEDSLESAAHEPVAATRAELVSSADEWRDAVGFGCGIVIEMRPELAVEWTGARLDKLADALAKCGAHYGWNIEKLLGHPLFGLAFATWPLAHGLIKVERARSKITDEVAPA